MRPGECDSRNAASGLYRYRRLSFSARVIIGHRVLWRLFGTRLFWRAALLFLCLSAVMQIIAWHHDLRGLQRDLLLCLPALLYTPLIAVARRRGIARVLAEQADQQGAGRAQTDPPDLTKSG